MERRRRFPVLGLDWRKYEDEGHEVLGERLAGWQEQYPDVTSGGESCVTACPLADR